MCLFRRSVHQVEDEINSPVVVFRFSQDASEASSTGSVQGYYGGDREVQDALNRWLLTCGFPPPQLGERLSQLVPASGVDVVELEDEGTCVRFNPLMTAAVQGTQEADVDALVQKLGEMVPLLSSTLRLRQDFREETIMVNSRESRGTGLSGACGVEGPLGYMPCSEELDDSKRQSETEKINSSLLKKLQELEADLSFSTGPEFGQEKNCIFVGMATEDLDVAELVDTIAAMGREIEESGKGVLRQIPVVGSVLNWFSPVQSSVKGRTFSLAAGSLDSTETTYSMKVQTVRGTPPATPTSSAGENGAQRFEKSFHILQLNGALILPEALVAGLPGGWSRPDRSPAWTHRHCKSISAGSPAYANSSMQITQNPSLPASLLPPLAASQKLFRRTGANSDMVSETSSVGQPEEVDRREVEYMAAEEVAPEPSQEPVPGSGPEAPQQEQTPLGEGVQSEAGQREPEAEGTEELSIR
ncbi:hypothetical protein JZ751_006200 [Albula glossodonta]|uniref:Uncharacterized protein n=1 Tax=Albula glossodonta TaxID=121402 RepID=A0A8T2NES9_9TELE|nr:hypothetical protein JZ751_006200 [Albula glossodonta]